MKPGTWTRQGLATLFLIAASATPGQTQQSSEDGFAAYERGDYATALKIWKPLAKQGSAGHQYTLGIMYHDGQGVVQDYGEAVTWFRRAAEQGHNRTQLNLGNMYGQGKGVTQDYVQAHMWLNLTAASLPPGEEPDLAVENRNFAESKMTPAQVAEAQRLARGWKPK